LLAVGKSIVKAVVKYGGNAVGFGIAGELIMEYGLPIAQDIWNGWGQHKNDAGAWQEESSMSVRRGKVSFFSGCNSHLASVAPASSNRSGGGGNEAAEAFDGKGRSSDSASRQART
jgi:hypothetical protein